MKRRWNVKTWGFTIVELLIVVTVISILAAITVVTYSGAQSRARNTQTITSTSDYSRAIHAYYNMNGKYPYSPANTIACLGPVGVKCGNLTDTTTTCGFGQATYQAAFANDIATTGSAPTNPSDQTVTCSGKKFGGVIYVNYGTSVILYVFLRNVTSCPSVSGATLYSSGAFGDGYICTLQIAN